MPPGVDVDPVDDEPPERRPAVVDELLDVGTAVPRWWPRVPPAIRWLAVVAVAAGVVVGYLHVAHRDGARPSTASRPTPGRESGRQLAGSNPDLAELLAVALQRAALRTYVRPGGPLPGCAVVSRAASPAQVVPELIRTILPGFVIRDTAYVFDQSTELCTMDVRASDRRHTVLLVRVSAPERRSGRDFTTLRIDVGSFADTTVSAASARTPAGWSVTVAAIGAVADQPPSSALIRLAQDARLMW